MPPIVPSSPKTEPLDRLIEGMKSNGCEYLVPAVQHVVEHFLERGATLKMPRTDKEPSLTVRGPVNNDMPLFRIATNGANNGYTDKTNGRLSGEQLICYVEVTYGEMSRATSATGNDNLDLSSLAESLSQIDHFPSRISTPTGRPNFYLHDIRGANQRDQFIAAYDAIFDQLSNRSNTAEISSEKSRVQKTSQEELLARAWDILVDCAQRPTLEKAKITYGNFRNAVLQRPSDDRVPATGTGRILYPIQNLCADNELPPLTGLVVSTRTGLPSSGYAGSGDIPYEVEMKRVLRYDWTQEDNPWRGGNGEVLNLIEIQEKLLAQPGRGQTYTTVPVRQYQGVFRELLLKAYGGRCAVCGIAIEAMLDAAHIKPWAVCTPQEQLDVRNGMLLCKNHHVSFDKHLWWVTDTFEIEKKKGFATTLFGEQTSTLNLPTDHAHRPLVSYITHHRDNR